MNLALRKIIYDPISYIHPQRVSLNNTPINNPVLRSITNEMILLQYNLSVEHFNLNSSLIYYINNWNLLPLICLLSGCHFYRERFAERGFFYKVPDVLRDYLSAIPLEINEKARYKPGIANYHNIITCGFSTLLPYIRQQPLAMQQRFNLLFPDFVDHIQSPLPLASTLLERITFYAKKIEMSLIKSPANGVVIKRKISDGLKEIVSLKEKILLETTAKIQSIEEKREEKFIQGYYDGYTKGIIDEMDNFIPLISLLCSELEKKRINMINDLKSILLKPSEEVDVFIKIFESWVTKLPSISGPVNLHIPTSFKDKSLEVESYFVDKSIWNVHITFHDDKRFVFFTDQFIAEFSPQEFVDNCEQYLINNHCFSPDKVNEICEQARYYLVEKMFETHSLDMNNSVLASPEDL